MAKISKDMLINDILAIDAGNAAILMAAGMHCIGCLCLLYTSPSPRDCS